MPTFTYDLSPEAIGYVKASIQGMPGNPGQQSLVDSLSIDCSCILEVNIAGAEVNTESTGFIKLNSNHPEAIEQIISAGEDHFEEFKDGLSKVSFAASASLNILETIRQDKIDEAFDSL